MRILRVRRKKDPRLGAGACASRTRETGSFRLRCTEHERAGIKAVAEDAGFSVGAFLRLLALGDAGPRAVRRPPAERAELARILAQLGKIGSNVNQIAKAIHTTRNLPSWSELAVMRDDIGQMCAALMKALGYDHRR